MSLSDPSSELHTPLPSRDNTAPTPEPVFEQMNLFQETDSHRMVLNPAMLPKRLDQMEEAASKDDTSSHLPDEPATSVLYYPGDTVLLGEANDSGTEQPPENSNAGEGVLVGSNGPLGLPNDQRAAWESDPSDWKAATEPSTHYLVNEPETGVNLFRLGQEASVVPSPEEDQSFEAIVAQLTESPEVHMPSVSIISNELSSNETRLANEELQSDIAAFLQEGLLPDDPRVPVSIPEVDYPTPELEIQARLSLESDHEINHKMGLDGKNEYHFEMYGVRMMAWDADHGNGLDIGYRRSRNNTLAQDPSDGTYIDPIARHVEADRSVGEGFSQDPQHPDQVYQRTATKSANGRGVLINDVRAMRRDHWLHLLNGREAGVKAFSVDHNGRLEQLGRQAEAREGVGPHKVVQNGVDSDGREVVTVIGNRSKVRPNGVMFSVAFLNEGEFAHANAQAMAENYMTTAPRLALPVDAMVTMPRYDVDTHIPANVATALDLGRVPGVADWQRSYLQYRGFAPDEIESSSAFFATSVDESITQSTLDGTFSPDLSHVSDYAESVQRSATVADALSAGAAVWLEDHAEALESLGQSPSEQLQHNSPFDEEAARTVQKAQDRVKPNGHIRRKSNLGDV